MSKYKNEEVENLAGMFKALSNPNRLRIVIRMLEMCEPGIRCRAESEELRCCVGEFSEHLGLAPSTVSHHIKELRLASLIRVERCGKTVECWVNDQALRALLSFFDRSQTESTVLREVENGYGREKRRSNTPS